MAADSDDLSSLSSRRESANDSTPQGAIAPHPKAVSFRRESAPRRDSLPRRSSKSLDFMKQLHEQSPLLSPQSQDGRSVPPITQVISPLDDEAWNDGPSEETKSSWYLVLLTLSIGGLQIAWSVELSNGSPYLLNLGLSKSLLAIVWIAGPLSGTLVQPYVGLKSDRCRSRWGKRRPFMVGGAIATITSLLCLAWTKEIVGGFLHLFGVDGEAKGVYTAAICFAVLFIYILDFSINVIQAGIRAFIVDCAPTHQQEDANAWASRITGVGNIIGYLSGYVNLPKIMPFFGDTQFKVLCVIASFAMASTLAISCIAVQERDPRLEGEPEQREGGLLAIFKEMWVSFRRLPPQILKVCRVQFFAWIGWFPFLFYITTYVGEIYVESIIREHPGMTDGDLTDTWEHATRIGTFALLIFALTTFASSVFLPFIVAPTYRPPPPTTATPLTPTTAGSLSASGYFSYKPKSTVSKWQRWLAILAHLQIPALTLRRTWLLSHVYFAACMLLTFAVRSVTGATVLVGLIGLPWAITCWAPYALISAEISKRDAIRRGLLRAPPSRDGELLARGQDGKADQAGVVLGIHNVAIAAPQVIATLVSSAIFRALQKPRGSVDDNSVAWVLRFGGVCALLAAWFTRSVSEERDEER